MAIQLTPQQIAQLMQFEQGLSSSPLEYTTAGWVPQQYVKNPGSTDLIVDGSNYGGSAAQIDPAWKQSELYKQAQAALPLLGLNLNQQGGLDWHGYGSNLGFYDPTANKEYSFSGLPVGQGISGANYTPDIGSIAQGQFGGYTPSGGSLIGGLGQAAVQVATNPTIDAVANMVVPGLGAAANIAGSAISGQKIDPAAIASAAIAAGAQYAGGGFDGGSGLGSTPSSVNTSTVNTSTVDVPYNNVQSPDYSLSPNSAPSSFNSGLNAQVSTSLNPSAAFASGNDFGNGITAANIAANGPSLSSMGGGQGLTVPMADGSVAGSLGVTAPNATVAIGNPGSFINNANKLGVPVVGPDYLSNPTGSGWPATPGSSNPFNSPGMGNAMSDIANGLTGQPANQDGFVGYQNIALPYAQNTGSFTPGAVSKQGQTTNPLAWGLANPIFQGLMKL